MNHSFNIEYAEGYGLEESIVIENFIFWIKKNHANNDNKRKIEIDGVLEERTFTYNSAKALVELFPYLKSKSSDNEEAKIYRIMASLEKQGVLIKAHFNSNNHNRITWYCFKDENKFLGTAKKAEIQFTKSSNETNPIYENVKSNLRNRKIQFTKSSNLYTDINKDTKPNIKKEEEEEAPTPKIEKKIEESSFANQMLSLREVVSSPVLNRNEAFQRVVNTISRIKKREKGELVGYDSINKNEQANLYCLVDQFDGNEKVVEQILNTMLEYQKTGKFKLYSDLMRTTKTTTPDFWNKATISAFYIVKFANDKEIIDAAIRENEIYQSHIAKKKEFKNFANSPAAKINIPIDPEFAKQLKELKDKPVVAIDELELKRKADLEKLKKQISGIPIKSEKEIKEQENLKKIEMLEKMSQKKAG